MAKGKKECKKIRKNVMIKAEDEHWDHPFANFKRIESAIKLFERAPMMKVSLTINVTSNQI